MRTFATLFLSLVACDCILAVTRLQESNLQQWSRFKREHGKTYSGPEEEARRFANFMVAKSRVNRHNAMLNNSYEMELNWMADWTDEEQERLNGFRARTSSIGKRELSGRQQAFIESLLANNLSDPDEVDWRKVDGRVTEVKSQGDCGSCWALSTTGLLEGQQLAQNITRQVISLSEQNLLDCSQHNFGCGGGSMNSALVDIHKMGGIESELDYPYVATDQECRFNKTKAVMTSLAAVLLPKNDEIRLKSVVARYGPVAGSIFAKESLVHYAAGIYDDPTCPQKRVNHGILIVGYGTDAVHGDFWIVKNSWGAKWGEQGYFRVKRGTNSCAIARDPIIATF